MNVDTGAEKEIFSFLLQLPGKTKENKNKSHILSLFVMGFRGLKEEQLKW